MTEDRPDFQNRVSRKVSGIWALWCRQVEKLPEWLFAPGSIKPPEDRTSDYDANSSAADRAFALYTTRRSEYREMHRELSGTIRQLGLFSVAACAFCLMTIFSKTDKDLLFRGKSDLTLPILDQPVMLSIFVDFAPIGLIAIYIVLLIFAGQHRRVNSGNQATRPMLHNFDGKIARAFSVFVVYWMVPATLAIFVWKIWPFEAERSLLIMFAGTVVVSLFVQARRACKNNRPWALPAFFIVACAIAWVTNAFVVGRAETLSGASLIRADLSDVELPGAQMQNIDLFEGTLNFANLNGANLQSARMTGVVAYKLDASGAFFFHARLNGADLRGANLRNANFTNAELVDADLQFSRMDGVELSGADLRGADLRRVSGLKCPVLESANNWQKAVRSKQMKCGGQLPESTKSGPFDK